MAPQEVIPRPIRLARVLTERLCLKPPVDVMVAIQSVGLSVYEVDLSPKGKGFLGYHDAVDTFGIFVSSHRGPPERRFILAHELGHYVLHEDVVRDAGPSNCLRVPWMEREVTAFAFELLMPEAEVHPICRRLLRAKESVGPPEVAPEQFFGVTREAWCRRINRLGYSCRPHAV